MRTLVLMMLLAMFGCITPADKRDWDAAMKDLHGHNMKMQGETHTPYENGSQPVNKRW